MVSSAIYSALHAVDDIRLIRLLPGRSDNIACEIVSANVASPSIYEALSYTWDLDVPPLGPETYPITVSGHPFTVTPNLYFALRRLRHGDTPRLLWIDAICINQKDLAERGEQVQIMSRIYSSASRVIVWLGEEEANDTLAFDKLRQWSSTSSFEDMNSLTAKPWKSDGVREYSSTGWPALASLLSRRWFRRVWVLQEVLVATHVVLMCGSHQIPWRHLENVIWQFTAHGKQSLFERNLRGEIDMRGRRMVMKIRRLSTALAGGWHPTLLDLLQQTILLEATDPRDKIFALLCLRPDSEIKPDYDSPVDELLTKLDCSFLQAGDLRFLSFFDKHALERSSDNRATWAPSWLSPDPGRNAFLEYDVPFCATCSRRAEPRLSVNTMSLTLQGIILDELCLLGLSLDLSVLSEVVEGDWRNVHMYREMVRFLDSCEQVSLTAEPASHAGQTAKEAFWRTLICNTINGGKLAPQSLEASFDAYREAVVWMLQDCAPLDYEVESAETSLQSTKFRQALMKWVGGRVFCRTKNGYMGMVPAESKPKDLVCAFLGAKTPFVIRAKPDGSYQLIGECYVHLMMDGQVLDLPDFGQRLEDIVLR